MSVNAALITKFFIYHGRPKIIEHSAGSHQQDLVEIQSNEECWWFYDDPLKFGKTSAKMLHGLRRN